MHKTQLHLAIIGQQQAITRQRFGLGVLFGGGCVSESA